MANLQLDPATTALVAIDLQQGILAMPIVPHSSAEIISRTAQLAKQLRAQGGTVVFVRVPLNETLRLPVDAPMRAPDAPPLPESASELAEEIGREPSDLVVSKRQWGAFYATDLDQHLRRRGIRTILLTGVATNFGVESTGRAAAERGYEVVFVEDAMSTVSPEAQSFAVTTIFPRIGRVRSTNTVLEALQG